MRMGEAINDMKRWMSSDSSDDEAPEEVKFVESKVSALNQRRQELASKKNQLDSKRKKRQEIEERNRNQKKARQEHLSQDLLDEVKADEELKNDEKEGLLTQDDEEEEAGGSMMEEKKAKRTRSKKRLNLPETDYEFIPLSGVNKIPNKLVYKNRDASLKLNFKERMLSSGKRIRREPVGKVVGKMAKQRTGKHH